MCSADILVFHFPPSGGQFTLAALFFCCRAAPKQKAPPWGAASRRRSVGAFLLPGRPKAKSAPLGGSKPKAQRGGFFAVTPATGIVSPGQRLKPFMEGTYHATPGESKRN